MRTNAISAVLVLFLAANSGLAQVEEARQAIERGENVRAVNILSAELAERPTADTYLYLGIAYRNMKEYLKAEDAFTEGSRRFPDNPRFHYELANLFIENNDVESARSELRRALLVDPGNSEASDLLATIDMSEGEVQSALRAWNKSGRPIVDDILHNYYLTFGSWSCARPSRFIQAGFCITTSGKPRNRASLKRATSQTSASRLSRPGYRTTTMPLSVPQPRRTR